jgi:hypothetical protein|nr:MAG TPA: Photosynthesis system II assembly factor YCF48 [Caudoviricetes sp.]
MPIISAFPTGESTVDYTGPKSGLPSLEEGKVAYVTDEKRLYTGNADGTNTQIPNADDLSAHTSNKENPHGVTAEQVGAAAKDLSNVQLGLAFEKASLPSLANWQSVCYGNGKYVAVAYESNKAAYSTDGITWTETTLPSSAKWCSVCYGNGKFVAVAGNSDTAAYSTDGITWTAATMPSPLFWYSVAYGNGKFVAVTIEGDTTAYSTDGITWSLVPMPPSCSSYAWQSVTYGNGKFVMVAEGSDAAAYSTDGINWTRVTLPLSASWCSVTSGNGKFVAVARNSATAAYSTDGITWTAATMPSSASWSSVAYGNGKFVAVANGSNKAAYADASPSIVEQLSDSGLAKKSDIASAITSAAPSACKVTLSASGWDSSAKTQSATVSGVLEDESKQLIMPMPAGTSMSAYNEAGIQMTAQAANTVTFTADTVPKVDVEVWVVVQSVNDVTPPHPLDQESWDYISKQSLAGNAKNIWAVGDCKKIKLSGTAGTGAIDTTLYVYILDFDHDKFSASGAADGITFGTFKTAASNGIDVALCASNYGKTDGGFCMNTRNTNSGGWKNSDMRYNILGSTNTQNGDATVTTATSPKANTLMSCLPSDLRAVMRPMYVYTDNTGGGSDTASYVTGTLDYLPLLAEYEVYGARSKANSAEKNNQTQYAYYKNGNSNKKFNHSATSSAVNWWVRSPCYNESNNFCLVNSNSLALGGNAIRSFGVAPVFKV